MKALIQRVSRASVTVDDEITGSIGKGYALFLGVRDGDTEDDARLLAHKTVRLRIFPDDSQRMNLSIQDVEGQILVVSQFTLYADTRKGNRPSFAQAADPALAQSLYETYIAAISQELSESRVATGRFGAMMSVEIINDGPVTIEINTDG